MRTRLGIGSPLRTSAIVIVLTAFGVVGTATRMEAVIAIIRSTGIFSLAPGQATVGHLVNTGNVGGIIINWRVLDETGALLAESGRREVAPGASDSFDFRPAATGRLPIRFDLTTLSRSGAGKPVVLATQEVFNSSDGSTTIVLPYIE